jgi:glycosyltransferase involved in cell wall biosynthesis
VYNERVVSVTVPALDEEAHIAQVITTMPDWVDHIVVVDDNSSDATVAKVEVVGDPRVVLVRHDTTTGVGGAILDGHRAGMALGSDVCVVMAGDAQMDPAYLSALLDPVCGGGYGFAKANRFSSISSIHGMPKHRIVGNIVLSFLTKLASGYWNLFDAQNGYTATTTETLERLDFDRIAQGYEFENDLLINLNILDVRATDVPIPAVYGDEISGMRLANVVPAITALLFRGFWKRIFGKYVLRSFSPIALFLFLGLAMCAWGVLFGAWVIWQTLGPPVATTGTVLLAVVPFTLGVLFVLQALVLDIQASPDRRT